MNNMQVRSLEQMNGNLLLELVRTFSFEVNHGYYYKKLKCDLNLETEKNQIPSLNPYLSVETSNLMTTFIKFVSNFGHYFNFF